jgi:hypothetical protein
MAPKSSFPIFLPKEGRFRLLPIFMSTLVFWSRYRPGSRPVYMSLSHETADYENYEANDKDNQGGV